MKKLYIKLYINKKITYICINNLDTIQNNKQKFI